MRPDSGSRAQARRSKRCSNTRASSTSFDAQERARPGAELRGRARSAVAANFARAVETAAANIRAYAELQMPRGMDRAAAAGPAAGPDRAAARYGGGVHSGGPLSAALHAADDRDSRAGGRRAEHLRRVARSRCRRSSDGAHCWVCNTSFRWAARRPSRRSRSAPRRCRGPTASSGPGNIYVAAAKKLLAGEVGIDFVAGPDRDPDHRGRWRSAPSRGRHAGAGRARCGSVGDPADHFASGWPQRWRKEVERQLGDSAHRARWRARRSRGTARSSWCARSTKRWRFRTASRRSI